MEQASETLEAVRRRRAELEAEAEREIERIAEAYDSGRFPIERVALRPRASELDVRRMALAWVPYVPGETGELTMAIEEASRSRT